MRLENVGDILKFQDGCSRIGGVWVLDDGADEVEAASRLAGNGRRDF